MSQPPAAPSSRFDLPYSARPPRLVNAAVGLAALVARRGADAGYHLDVTLLDAPDHRLIRSGVLLGHRVLEGRGDWYLGAPDWAPALPAERVEPMSQAELPEEFADLVRPFRRRAALGPVAGLHVERAEFAFRDEHGATLALLRDDKVTVRRGGLTTARFREVQLTPVGAGLDEAQRQFLAAALASTGATEVAQFPPLVARLGVPATGLTDYPAPTEVDARSRFDRFVGSILAGRLRELVTADLGVRTGAPGAVPKLHEIAAALRTDLQGLAPVLEPMWSEDLQEELDWLVEQAEQQLAHPAGTADGAALPLLIRLRGERYLTLLERLVHAVRAPQTGDAGRLRSGNAIDALLNEAMLRLAEAVAGASVDSPQLTWDAVADAMADVDRAGAVAERLDRRRVNRLRRRLAPARALLIEVDSRAGRLDTLRVAGESQSGREAFETGRQYERELRHLDAAREAFLDRWPAVAAKLERSDRPGESGRAGRRRSRKSQR